MNFLKIIAFIVTHPIGKRRKLLALNRLIRWQIVSRLSFGGSIVDWVNSTKFIAKSGEAGLTGNVYVGLHEFADMMFLLHFLRPYDLFVDVGANSGSYTLLAASKKDVCVYSFEPDMAAYKRLTDNCKLNNYDSRINLFNVAVGEKSGNIKMTVDLDCMNYVLPDDCDTEKSQLVKIDTLNNLLRDMKASIIKIDVEGLELPVINGASDVLCNPHLKAVIMELNGSCLKYGYNEQDIINLFSDYGFSRYLYEPFSRTLTSLGDGQTISGNTLFIRDVEAVKNRVVSAEKVSILELDI